MDPEFRSYSDVNLVDHGGSDELICQAARVSTLGAAATESKEAQGLIKFLMTNRHGSPFEHGWMTFMVEAPIVVFREFFRHRVGWSYNEASGRYKELAPVFYVPPRERPLVQVGKPGQYRYEPGTTPQFLATHDAIKRACHTAWAEYQRMLANGIAKEVARGVLPVYTFSAAYVTCNPRSLMHFLSLRTQHEDSTFPSFPMYEIARVADALEGSFAVHWPLTYQAFTENGRVSP